jgi:Brp/Blh family beta-carotene 15,15'-monooxygenase
LSSNNLAVLTFGLLIIGIPHGALDHLTEILSKKNTINLKFIFYYLLMMVPILLIWFWIPTLGLVFFLIYSAWHFGQTEINNWKIDSNAIAIFWGTALFSSLFLIHFEEFSKILLIMNIKVPMVNFNYVLIGNLLLIFPFLTAIYYQKLEWLIIVAFFLLSNKESLLLTFGLYFIFQHSRIGWMHLKNKLKHTHLKMFKNALPFNVGAIFLYLIAIYYLNLNPEKSIAYFFVFLSAISFPHVICMHFFYKKNSIK